MLQISSFENPNLQKMLQLQGASPLTPFAIMCFQIFVRYPLSRVKCYKFPPLKIQIYKKMLQLQGASPLTPFAYNIFPDICWRSPFRVKGYKCLPLNTQIYKKCFSFRVKGCTFIYIKHIWVYTHVSASGGKPPDPLCNNVFPDLCWRSPFRVKGYKCLPLNTQIYKKCFSFRGQAP